MGGLFGLNGAETQSTLSFATCAVSMLAYLHMRRLFPRVTTHGSLVEAQIADDQVGGQRISEDIARLYTHPGLQPLPYPVPNLSGVEGLQLSKLATTLPAYARAPGDSDLEKGVAITGYQGTDLSHMEGENSPAAASQEATTSSEQFSIYLDARDK